MWKIFIVLAILAEIMIVIQKKIPKTNQNKYEEYVYKRELLTKNEAEFFQELQKILPETVKISCKCRLEDLIGIKNGPQKQALRNKVRCRHIDFTLHDKSGNIFYVIELDDKTHRTRQQEDKLKNEIIKAAKIPLIRIKAKSKYIAEEIYREIYQEINLG